MKKDLIASVAVPGASRLDATRSERWIDAFCAQALAEMMTRSTRKARDGDDRDPADCRCAEPRVRAGGDVRADADVPCRCRTDDRYLMAA